MELSHIRGHVTVPSNHLVQIMRQHPLVFYFLIAFGLSWAYELLVFGILRLPFDWIWVLLLTLGPTLAAFLMTAIIQGRTGALRLLRLYVLWRVGIRWYLLVLLGVPALLLLPYLIQPGAFSALRLSGLPFLLDYLIVYLSTLVFGGHWGRKEDGAASRSHAWNSNPVRWWGPCCSAYSGACGTCPSSCSFQGIMGLELTSSAS